MDELEKKLEAVRQRRERNKAWVEATKNNRVEVKNQRSSEESVLEVEKVPQSKSRDLTGLGHFVFSFLGVMTTIILTRKSKEQLFIHSEAYIIACKSKILMDAKKHRAIKFN